jgi:AP2 domain
MARTDALVAVSDAGGRRVAAYATIDPASEWLREYRWYRLTPDGAPVTFGHPAADGRPATMAEVLLDLVGREEAAVRHRNGDPLDHRRANLEVVAAEPGAASEAEAAGARRSRYRHVLYDPEHEAWVAYGYAAGRYVHLGRFDDELAAARAARAWAVENQSIHLEDDHAAGGYGRGSKAPTPESEARRLKR